MSAQASPRQAAILVYIRDVEAVLGERPTQAQIARRFKVTQPTARAHVVALERKGLLRSSKPCPHPSGEHHAGSRWRCTECGEFYTCENLTEDDR